MDYAAFLENAGRVRPSRRQAAFMRDPFYAFVHFGPNTYTNREWGLGNESPSLFQPTALDCDQWVAAIKAAGMTGLVLTAKHHDGFCLWPSRFTEHSVKNSLWMNGRGDVVRMAAEACRRGGIRFGFYLSPWDRNCPFYGTEAYNEYYKNQLTELLTQYGDIFYVWFDGACGEGPNGRRQRYDFEGYIDLVRRYQPNACIFSDTGPDIRWCGNESGRGRHAEWMTVPSELCPLADRQTEGSLLPGGLPDIYNDWGDLGSLDVIAYSRGLAFCPAEVDMSIRPGWFYHPEEAPHELEKLLQAYMTSVGGSAAFNLNVPPMPSGQFDPRDVQRLSELGKALRQRFGREIGADDSVTREEISPTQCVFHVRLPKAAAIRCVSLSENIQEGQRIARFRLSLPGARETLFSGATVGARRICPLGSAVETDALDVHILSARGRAEDLTIRLY